MKLLFEVFPPKAGRPTDKVLCAVDDIAEMQPDYISVTHGAGGTNEGQQFEILNYIEKSGIPSVANLTCIGKTDRDILYRMNELKYIGCNNILALRGDIPDGQTGTGGSFLTGTDLVAYLTFTGGELLNVFAPCYPEKHIDAASEHADKAILQAKSRCGAKAFISQMCYDYGKIVDMAGFVASLGKELYIGIMPVTDKQRIINMCLKNGVSIPAELSAIMGKYDDPVDFRYAGMEYTEKLMCRLMCMQPDGFQIFSMNDADTASELVKAVGLR